MIVIGAVWNESEEEAVESESDPAGVEYRRLGQHILARGCRRKEFSAITCWRKDFARRESEELGPAGSTRVM
jgi:hypothetical protein